MQFVIRCSSGSLIQRFTSSPLVLKWPIITTRHRVREGSVFSRVCLFTGESTCDHYPWCHWSVKGHMGTATSVQTCSLGTPPPITPTHRGTHQALPPHPYGDPPDFSKLIPLGTPSQSCSNVFTFCPYIYRWAGGWPLTERHSCEVFFLYGPPKFYSCSTCHLHLGLLRISKRGHFQSFNFYLIKVQKKIQENFSDNSYYFFLKVKLHSKRDTTLMKCALHELHSLIFFQKRNRFPMENQCFWNQVNLVRVQITLLQIIMI